MTMTNYELYQLNKNNIYFMSKRAGAWKTKAETTTDPEYKAYCLKRANSCAGFVIRWTAQNTVLATLNPYDLASIEVD